jgi:hypothetical protein
MANTKKLIQAAAGAAGGAGLDVSEVFSTYLYTGNRTARNIVNGIDLAGEGGMVWTAARNVADNKRVWDSERGVNKDISTNSTAAESTRTGALTAFNSDGFSLGVDGAGVVNANSGETYASWTFRKAPKFFDVVTYTGTGSAQTISHDLGTTVGTIIVKRTDSAGNWRVFHRSLGATQALTLSSTAAAATSSSYWNNTAPTDTQFTVGTDLSDSGASFVAYLFAHNDGDGEFGPDGDADIIKCGSFTEVNGSDVTVDLGFEPQWIMIKASSTTGNWGIYDVMRGWTSGSDDIALTANTSDAESNVVDRWLIHPDGFTWKNTSQARDIIYIAIRRGPMAVPTDATDVFDVDISTQAINSSNAPPRTPFPVDMGVYKARDASGTAWPIFARLQGANYLQTQATDAEGSGYTTWDQMDGWGISTASWESSADYVFYNWKRAPNYFDVVAYTGTGSNTTIQHNLGVKPEMIWVKNRDDGTYGWYVYHEAVTANDQLYLHLNNAAGGGFMNNTEPTDTVFTLGVTSGANASGQNHIAYLFASLDGVSKVGSYTGNGTSQTIDCGFSSGARFVLIKRSSNAQDWYIFDTERGIVAGNDPYLKLNTTDSEATAADEIDPLSSGFTVHQTGSAGINFNGHTYIFYAIA